MPHATADDGVKLYYEETGTGVPVIFVHEFAGDLRSWEAQLRYFGQRYHAIAYNARGYPPSDVPEDVGKYSQNRMGAVQLQMIEHGGDVVGREATVLAPSARKSSRLAGSAP